MLTQKLIADFWCPTCQQGELRSQTDVPSDSPMEEDELICMECNSTYPVRFGVPALLPHGPLNTEDWRIWEEHLQKFQERREDRIRNPDRRVTQWARHSRPNQAFAKFTGIAEGTVLDVGCGPGKFRFIFDGNRVRYIGLDPIVLDDVHDFPFARGLAEYIPFKDKTFTDVVVLAALDHFRDLDRFFREAQRVLVPTGKLHILQSVHEIRGPTSAIRVLGHKLKDAVEERHAKSRGEGPKDVPKHLAEFTSSSLSRIAEQYFDVMGVERYSSKWYTPIKMFLSLQPKEVV